MDYSDVGPRSTERWNWNKGKVVKKNEGRGKILPTKQQDGRANDTHHTAN